jgi:hypothetical protein
MSKLAEGDYYANPEEGEILKKEMERIGNIEVQVYVTHSNEKLKLMTKKEIHKHPFGEVRGTSYYHGLLKEVRTDVEDRIGEVRMAICKTKVIKFYELQAYLKQFIFISHVHIHGISDEDYDFYIENKTLASLI